MEKGKWIRRPYLIEEDDGLVSIVDMEAGFSGNNFPLSLFSRTKLSVSSHRFHRLETHNHHFLKACFLCNKPLTHNQDLFMYRGDTPFCSEECRQQQIETDEAKEKKMSLSSSIKAMRKKDNKKSTSPAGDYRTSTVAAA